MSRCVFLVAVCLWCACGDTASATLIAHYTFDNGTYNVGAGTVDDVADGDVGNNQVQQIAANTTMGVDSLPRLGQAVQFDAPSGSSNQPYLKIPNAQLFGPGRDALTGMSVMSLTTWFKPDPDGFMWSVGSAR